ncbi:hypothetical protein BBW65_05190 [Helicobacter enhydrae]|uniref:Ppx/GppA phosphatase N-terminal domain-containing protein n=1 Tax=Helicobacter enhydrae TaxID=222136 RepID=A0A1B1U678_9HELI|nr:Ppx/GppA phosphatase family protein [Helicobacter enhydrae]ANV98231.1 hypothetical protein BBW65_05190 [Helicobacter enhydrae]
MSKIVAVIDIGSNSVRMAIYRRTSRFGFFLLDEKKSRVRISEGSYENQGVLQEIPMQRTINALADFMQIAKMYRARKIFCVATSALRDAPNAAAFLKRVKVECGLQIKIIDGAKEAYYGSLACVNLLHQKTGLSIDVGGGSTEFGVIEDGKILQTFSLNIGAIRIKELFLDTKRDFESAKEFIVQSLSSIASGIKCDVVLGIGGSIRALSKIILKEEREVPIMHGFEVECKRYIDFCNQIMQSDGEELRSMGFNEERLDSICAGALIFATILEFFQIKRVVTSGVGVREGVFLSDLLRNHHGRFPNAINPSLMSLLDRFSDQRSKRIKKEALALFDVLLPWHQCSQDLRYILECAGQLSVIGSVLGCHTQSIHSAHLAFCGLEYGFSYQDRFLIKNLIEFGNKKLPKDNKHKHLTLFELQALSFMLALAKIFGTFEHRITYEWSKEVLYVRGASYLQKDLVGKITKMIPIQWEHKPKSPMKSKTFHPKASI